MSKKSPKKITNRIHHAVGRQGIFKSSVQKDRKKEAKKTNNY